MFSILYLKMIVKPASGYRFLELSNVYNKKSLRDYLRLTKAVRTRLELATPCVTGMYSNQLNYRTSIFKNFWRMPFFLLRCKGSNTFLFYNTWQEKTR